VPRYPLSGTTSRPDTDTMDTATFDIEGREYRPTAADLAEGWEVPAGLFLAIRTEVEPDLDRIIGAVVRPLLSPNWRGQFEPVDGLVLVACVGDSGRIRHAWVPLSPRLLAACEEQLALAASAKKTATTETPATPVSRTHASAYSAATGDPLRDASAWAQEAYIAGDSICGD
jgi:hypothetical protein